MELEPIPVRLTDGVSVQYHILIRVLIRADYLIVVTLQ